jgi:hypothetical protein
LAYFIPRLSSSFKCHGQAIPLPRSDSTKGLKKMHLTPSEFCIWVKQKSAACTAIMFTVLVWGFVGVTRASVIKLILSVIYEFE